MTSNSDYMQPLIFVPGTVLMPIDIPNYLSRYVCSIDELMRTVLKKVKLKPLVLEQIVDTFSQFFIGFLQNEKTTRTFIDCITLA
jgi:hypothetical protein